MRLLLEHWGEHRDFSLGEVLGILRGEGLRYEILEDDFPVRVIETHDWKALKRAGFLRYLSKHLKSGDEIPEISLELDDFAVRARRYFGLREISESEVERRIGHGIKGRVNLRNPKNVVRVPIARRIHVGVLLHDFSEEGFEERKPSNLPISYPVTMHPRYTRALINLAEIKRGAKILDPFCGTGTILIEASLMGFVAHGSDIDERMIRAAETNLKRFSARATVERMDVGEISGNYDAIITDPPYGRSSSSKGEKIQDLYRRAFRKFSDITDRVAIVLPYERSVEIGKEFFELEAEYPVRVHKSLTRRYCLFRRE